MIRTSWSSRCFCVLSAFCFIALVVWVVSLISNSSGKLGQRTYVIIGDGKLCILHGPAIAEFLPGEPWRFSVASVKLLSALSTSLSTLGDYKFGPGASVDVVVPLWIGVATFAALALMVYILRRRAVATNVCSSCGYDLRSVFSNRCPECGIVFQSQHWSRCGIPRFVGHDLTVADQELLPRETAMDEQQDMDAFCSRLELLEHRLLRTRLLLLTLVIGFFAWIVYSTLKERTLAIRSPAFIVADEMDNAIIDAALYEDGSHGVALRNPDGVVLAAISVRDELPGLGLFDSNGTGRFKIDLDRETGVAVLALFDKNSSPRASLSLEDDGEPELVYCDHNKVVRTVFSLGLEGRPSFSVFDSTERLRVMIGVSDEWSPIITLKNEHGEVLTFDFVVEGKRGAFVLREN